MESVFIAYKYGKYTWTTTVGAMPQKVDSSARYRRWFGWMYDPETNSPC